MTFEGPIFAATLAGTLIGSGLLDALVCPRAGGKPRNGRGLWLLGGMAITLYGLFLGLSGNAMMAAVLTLAIQALLVVASNAKHAMLGEPLLFSDLALVGAVFRHPQFYLSAVRLWQRVMASVMATALMGAFVWFCVADMAVHWAGAALLVAGLVFLALSLRLAPWRALALAPAAHDDTRDLGLLPVLLLYWLRWRANRDPAPCGEPARMAMEGSPQVVVVVQCESFADPVRLFGDPALALPGLAAAQEQAMQWGDLAVSGFGAYTMRTEYGVLFGRDEAALGFRRYDPFLTASGEGSYALPARLRATGQDWRSLFLHPHDMRFYGRDQIMPAGGFAEMVGEERFAKPGPDEGRYVTDAAMADVILAQASAPSQPTFLYAVTIENHGPWAPDAQSDGASCLIDGYMNLVRHSDAMLTKLTAGLAALGRPAMLVFFGDHRPSIPGASMPPSQDAAGDRSTPYVMIRFDGRGRAIPGDRHKRDMTPAQLHHVVLAATLGTPVTAPEAPA